MQLITKTLRSEIYLLENGNVMKWYYSSISHEIIEREFIANLLLYKAAYPCVEPLEKFTKRRRAGLILPFISGKNLGDSMLSHPWKIAKYGRKMAELHFQLHQIPPINLPDSNATLLQTIEQSAADLGEYRTSILNIMSGLSKQQSSCCHGDFHPYNIMLSANKYFVIDWANVYLGAPLSDVARTALILESPYWSQDMPPVLTRLSRVGGNILRKSYLSNYLRLSASDLQQLKDWRLLQAVARLEEKIPGESKWLEQLIADYFKK